jgi:ribosome biogenesis GTPase A
MIGRMSFETPAMMEQELIELAVIRAEKAAKKEARKKKSKG